MKERLLKILDRCSEYSLYGFIISIPISNAAIETFFGFAFLFFLFKKALKPDFGFVKSYTHIFLFCFIVFISLSLFNSGPYIAKSLNALFFKWLEYILIFIITQDILKDRKKVHNCIVILLSLSLIIGIDALFQRFVGVDFLRQKKVIPLWGETMRYGGGLTASFHHYNSLGTYLVFNLSLLLGLLILKIGRFYKIVLFSLFILLHICLLMTFSRGSWLGFFCSVALLLALYHKVNKFIYVFIIYIFIIMFFPGLKERAMFADAGRFTLWKGTLAMIKDHPFLGMGLGSYMDYFRKYISTELYIRYAHNCYLQIWAEAGIFALLSFILFIGSILYKGIRAFKDKNSDFILLGFISAFFSFLVEIFFDSQLYSLQLSVLFWFMAGFIMAIIQLKPIADK